MRFGGARLEAPSSIPGGGAARNAGPPGPCALWLKRSSRARSDHHGDVLRFSSLMRRPLARFALDAPLEGTGFKPSVPLPDSCVRLGPSPLRDRFARDSPVEEAGFELSVPPAGAGLFRR
jgi:hypothetical protein